MNRFVSQKMRLIPIPLEGAARTHLRAHPPKDPYRIQPNPKSDLYQGIFLSWHETNLDTTAANSHILPVFPRVWELSSNLHAFDGKDHLYEKAFSCPVESQGAFGNERGLRAD